MQLFGVLVGQSGISIEFEGGNVVMDPSSRDHFLLEYVMASKRASKGTQYLFMATDKGQSGSLPLQFTFFSLVGNCGVVACPQVV